MQHGQSFVFRHVDLVQNGEATVLHALIDRAGTEPHLPVFKRVHADEAGGVHVDVEGNVPGRTAEHCGQVFRQDVFAGGLPAGQQQVFATQQGCGGLFPDVLSVIVIEGHRNPVPQGIRQRIRLPKGSEFPQQLRVDVFIFQ